MAVAQLVPPPNEPALSVPRRKACLSSLASFSICSSSLASFFKLRFYTIRKILCQTLVKYTNNKKNSNLPDKLHGSLQSSPLWWKLWYQEGFLGFGICPCLLVQHTDYLPPVLNHQTTFCEYPPLCIKPCFQNPSETGFLPFENHRSPLLSHEPPTKYQMSWSASSKSVSKIALHESHLCIIIK